MKRPRVELDSERVKESDTRDEHGAIIRTPGSLAEKLFKDSIPPELLARVEKLSFHSLRVELSRRRLPTSGLRGDLRQRLLADIATQSCPFISVPHKFPSIVKPPHPDILSRLITTSPPAPPKLQSQPVSDLQASVNSKIIVPAKVPDSLPHNISTGNVCNATINDASADTAPITSQVKPNLDSTAYCPVVGVLRVRTVWICGEHNMRAFWRHIGPLGKASLSRSSPCYFVHDERSWRGRAARQLLELEGKSNDLPGDCQTQEAVAPSPLDATRADLEHLQLTLVEAYYAAFVKKVLLLQDESGNRLEDAPSAWRLFCSRAGQKFPATFVVYCRYRSAGWIPRSGLKYGTDWVLYPASSKQHTHSPFCVVLKFRDNEPRRLDRTWVALQNRIRLIKNVSKTLIVTEVVTAPNVDMISDIRDAFRAVSVTELTVDRWVP